MSTKRHLEDLTVAANQITAAVEAMRKEASPDKKSRSDVPVDKGVGTTAESLDSGNALYRFSAGSYALVSHGTILKVLCIEGDATKVAFLQVKCIHSDGSCDGDWLYSYADIVANSDAADDRNFKEACFQKDAYALSNLSVLRFDVAYVIGVAPPSVRVRHFYDPELDTLMRVGDAAQPLTRYEEAFRDCLVATAAAARLKKPDRMDALFHTTFGKRVADAVPLVQHEHVRALSVESRRLTPAVQGTCALCKKGKTLTWTLYASYWEDEPHWDHIGDYGADCHAKLELALRVRGDLLKLGVSAPMGRIEWIRKNYKLFCYTYGMDEEPYESSPVLPSALVLAVNTAAAPPFPSAAASSSSSSSSSAAAAAAK